MKTTLWDIEKMVLKVPQKISHDLLDMTGIHKICDDFFVQCASDKEITDKEYQEIAENLMLVVISTCYGEPGIRFILDNQAEELA